MASDSPHPHTLAQSPNVQKPVGDLQPDSAPSKPSILKDVAGRKNRRRRRTCPVWLQSLIHRWKNSGGIRPALRHLLTTHKDEVISYSVSALVLCVVAAFFALWILPIEERQYLFNLLAPAEEAGDAAERVVLIDSVDSLKQVQTPSTTHAARTLETLNQANDAANPNAEVEPLDQLQVQSRATLSDLKMLVEIGEFGGRTAEGRQTALQHFGGNAASEQAVLDGLKWLSGIQRDDGGWDFQSQGEQAQPGLLFQTRNAATSLALLCFLGAGHTHSQAGPYQKTVRQGLKFLAAHSVQQQGTADLRGDFEGMTGMYTHGLATICLTEASAMEPNDQALQKFATQAIRFIERSQSSTHGGWRYMPNFQTGDTSVVGWMVMAIYSGRSSGIRPSAKTLRGTRKFLREAATDGSQAFYSYMPGQQRKASTTAIGLLCRMYTGWGPESEAIQKGVSYLSTIGPSDDDMYYNYYSTQVLHHYGGEDWKKWNNVMRDQLIDRQIQEGPAKGSWHPQGPHHEPGGQLYETTLCILTLEVYYRHLPLFQKLKGTEYDAVDAGMVGELP